LTKPPLYPPEAVKDHAEGKAMLQVTVGVDGSPTRVVLNSSSGNMYLDGAAIEAVEGWRFEPKRCAGQAVASDALLPVNFSLADVDSNPNSLIASKWDVAADSEPMEFSSVKDALPFLTKHKSALELPTNNPRHRMFLEQNGTATAWFIDTEAGTGWTTVVRWHQMKRVDTRFGLYAYLCEGPDSYCTNKRNEIVAYTKNHPLPPPPLQRAQ